MNIPPIFTPRDLFRDWLSTRLSLMLERSTCMHEDAVELDLVARTIAERFGFDDYWLLKPEYLDTLILQS